jgi:hypothetical protein
VPGRRLHESLDRILLGQRYPLVHRLLDLPSMWLGERHRELLHDELTATLAGLAVEGPRGALSALLHVWLDRALTIYSGGRRSRRDR